MSLTALARSGRTAELTNQLRPWLPTFLRRAGLTEALADDFLTFIREQLPTLGERRFREALPAWLEAFGRQRSTGADVRLKPLTIDPAFIGTAAVEQVLGHAPANESTWATRIRGEVRRLGLATPADLLSVQLPPSWPATQPCQATCATSSWKPTGRSATGWDCSSWQRPRDAPFTVCWRITRGTCPLAAEAPLRSSPPYDRYELLQVLGAGGQGQVYLCSTTLPLARSGRSSSFGLAAQERGRPRCRTNTSNSSSRRRSTVGRSARLAWDTPWTYSTSAAGCHRAGPPSPW